MFLDVVVIPLMSSFCSSLDLVVGPGIFGRIKDVDIEAQASNLEGSRYCRYVVLMQVCQFL